MRYKGHSVLYKTMCGIYCVLRPTTDYCNELRDLDHRGPYESGVWSNDDIWMGHVRLPLVAPQNGSQPIQKDDWIIVINGEIYNSDAGKGLSDVYGFDPESPEKIDGVFAYVAYHKETKRVVVARDAFGVIPLYMCHYGGQTYISSELKNLPPGAIMFPPGNKWICQNYVEQLQRFYYYDRVSRQVANDLSQRVLELLTAAVRKRLQGDTPWAVMLSGGLDSSAVAAIASRLAVTERPDYPVTHSFCIGLKGSPDLKIAREVASYIGTRHHSVTVSLQDMMDAVKDCVRVVETYDVTTIRASVPMMLLSRVMRNYGIRFVLSGEGSDEIFAGYLYNYYCPNGKEMFDECIRKVKSLCWYDCLRANKSTMAYSVECRVPFLDKELVRFALFDMAPEEKIPSHERPEKFYLRQAVSKLLPSSVLNRRKAQFSDAVGSKWIQALKQIRCEDFDKRHELFPHQTPDTHEAFYYRQLFEEMYPGQERACYYTGDSTACSSSTAFKWHSSFEKDPSGLSVSGI